MVAAFGLGAGEEQIRDHITHEDARVREHAARLAGMADDVSPYLPALYEAASGETDARVLREIVHAIGNAPGSEEKSSLFARVAAESADDPWMQLALLSGAVQGAGEILVASSSGSVALPVNLSNLPQPNGPVAAQPGETWSFQLWYRDANPSVTSNVSWALQLDFE